MPNSSEINIRIALIILGIVALVCLVGGIVLVNNDKSLPDALIALGASSVTAVTLVITRPVGGTQDVRVVDEPLEVQSVKASGATKKRARGAGGAITWAGIVVVALVIIILLMATGAITVKL